MMQKKILDLGCGKKKRSGAIGIDFNPSVGADIVHDLNKFPYPINDQEFDEVYLDNVLEHLDDVLLVMNEIHRISKPGAVVKVIVPYFRSHWAAIDPTHKHAFTTNSFAYYDPTQPFCARYAYTSARFKVKKFIFNESLPNRPFKKLIVPLANRWPYHYEYYFSHLLPLDDISFYLERV
jgi:ubiquinone/menaquinone biosynthesis C-methylase UbiE